MSKWRGLFKKNLKERMEALKLSQRALADRLGVARTGIAKQFDNPNPTLDKIVEIAEALGTTPAALLEDGEPRPTRIPPPSYVQALQTIVAWSDMPETKKDLLMLILAMSDEVELESMLLVFKQKRPKTFDGSNSSDVAVG